MIIGLNGFATAGKDTAGAFLVKHYGFKRIAFADKLKEAFALTFDATPDEFESYKSDPAFKVAIGWENRPTPVGFAKENPDASAMWSPMYNVTYRDALKNIGNLYRHLFGETFWIEQVAKQIDPEQNYVITDVRYENELEWIISVGGYTVRIVRPGLESDGHASEQQPPARLIDTYIYNDDTIEHLNTQVDLVYNELRCVNLSRLRAKV